jgi:hypothetical protein
MNNMLFLLVKSFIEFLSLFLLFEFVNYAHMNRYSLSLLCKKYFLELKQLDFCYCIQLVLNDRVQFARRIDDSCLFDLLCFDNY